MTEPKKAESRQRDEHGLMTQADQDNTVGAFTLNVDVVRTYSYNRG